MVTMGRGVVVSASPDIMPFLREQLDGKEDRDEAFGAPFICGCTVYFLPDKPRELPLPDKITAELYFQPEIRGLFSIPWSGTALNGDKNSERPDVIAIVARKNGEIIGMAGASEDCGHGVGELWQIGIEVLPEFRRLGIASALVSRLAREISRLGKVPYYGAAVSNVASQRTALRAGFKPVWVATYQGNFGEFAAK
jgi:GNAT superfamily N-acetyltransferase